MAKEKIICDTDVMIDFWDEKNSRHKSTTSILEDKILLDNVVLSAITKLELLLGAKNKTDANRINKQLGRFNITLLNDDITLQAFSLIQEYSLSHGLSLPDSLIASTAIITDLQLFTYNVKDFSFINKLTLYVP